MFLYIAFYLILYLKSDVASSYFVDVNGCNIICKKKKKKKMKEICSSFNALEMIIRFFAKFIFSVKTTFRITRILYTLGYLCISLISPSVQ